MSSSCVNQLFIGRFSSPPFLERIQSSDAGGLCASDHYESVGWVGRAVMLLSIISFQSKASIIVVLHSAVFGSIMPGIPSNSG